MGNPWEKMFTQINGETTEKTFIWLNVESVEKRIFINKWKLNEKSMGKNQLY